MNLLLEHKKLLEQYLTDMESDLHLQPRQLLRLMEEQKIDSLILYIKSCYQLCHLLHPNMDNLLITQFNQTMSKLLESGFTAEQLSLFKPSIYLKRDEQQAICQKIKFISKTYNDCTSELIAAHSHTFFVHLRHPLKPYPVFQARIANLKKRTLKLMKKLGP